MDDTILVTTQASFPHALGGNPEADQRDSPMVSLDARQKRSGMTVEQLPILALSATEFEERVAKAFTLCRDGTVTSLETSPLAHSALVVDCLLQDEMPAYGTHGRALHSVLRWAVTQLKPAGEASPTAVVWRPYHILQGFYLEGRRVSEVAERLGIVDTYFYEVRRQAIVAVSALLWEELRTPRSGHERRAFMLDDRYRGLTVAEQTLLRAAAIFQRPVPADWLWRLVERATPIAPHAALATLGPAWLLTDDRGREVFLRPDARNYVSSLLSRQERVTWHDQAATLYIEAHADYLTAVAHWRAAGDFQRAAQALIDHGPVIIAENGLEPVRAALVEFRAAELRDAVTSFPHASGGNPVDARQKPSGMTAEQLRRAPELWVRLKLLAGDVAERLQDLPSAITEYSAALQSAAPQIKAHACYRLAKVFERSKQVDEALATFQRGLDLLQPPDPLLATLRIHRAWVFIQPRPDRVRAESDLHCAESLLQPGDLANQADLHNAWAGFYTYLTPDPNQAITHRLQYWLLSKELGDIDRQIKAALNVGQDYLYEKRYPDALAYLEQGLALAIAAGDRSSEAQYHKIVGNARFFQAQYPAALAAYLRAYTIIKETGNRQWLARVCYDLAEVYAQLGEWETGNGRWEEGRRLAETLNDETALRDLTALERTYPRLRSGRLTLENRQQRLLDYLAQHETITRDQYQALTGMQKAQAARDLTSFVAQNVVGVTGKGPMTRYHGAKSD